jgi:hypothetical protein
MGGDTFANLYGQALAEQGLQPELLPDLHSLEKVTHVAG